ncbi:DUF1572 family protein [Humisphaera borealis]|uniref:DUF1572 family protein n=2 Tax=Humisphaera borealis TaxID=2807512 RepID=A0A7M2X454_9BACT|nr:DUF1572 family protein [Humisphaera borealis]
MIAEYRRYKSLADGAFAQVTDDQLLWKLSPAQNSLYVIAQHLSGNLRSRFTDFLTSDGEKPDRNRDGEFIEPAGPVSRPQFLAMWEAGWKVLFESLATLTDADQGRTVLIRTEPYTVAEALTRSVAHASYHVGQITLLAKHLKGVGWNYLTVPPGGTQHFNQQVAAGERSQRVK